MSHKNGDTKTYSARAVFEDPLNPDYLAMVTEIAPHKAGLIAVIGGRLEPYDANKRNTPAIGEVPDNATFRSAARREIKEETGGKGSSDPNDGIDVVVGEQIWEYHHDTNPNHITRVFAAKAIGGIFRPVGRMMTGSYSMEEIDDFHRHGMLRGWQDWRSVHEYWDRREDLLAEPARPAEDMIPVDLAVPQHLGELVLQG